MTKKKKVALIGYTPTRGQAPYDNPEFEIWGLNDLYKFKSDQDVKRWDRWFEIHDTKQDYTHLGRQPWAKLFEDFKKMGCPVYLQQKHPDIPNSIAYPIEEAVKQFGYYFTNTVSYMIALAIMEKFEEIHVYGIDMAVDSEYNYERPSCEYFLGVAIGRGIKVYIPPEADLLKSRFLYGYDDVREECFRKKLQSATSMMVERQKQAEWEWKNGEKVYWQYQGAIEAYKEAEKQWKLITGEVPDIKV